MNDRIVVGQQIGRTPRGQFVVSLRCSHGYPQVIRVHPLVLDKPFPTLYWLTCPFLSHEIAQLEAAGWVKQLEARMIRESELWTAMQAAHQRYCRQRDRLMSPQEKATLEANGMIAGLSRRGIGGLSDWNRLKCLHLHVAHELADKNAIGDIVLEILPARECPSQQVICSAYA